MQVPVDYVNQWTQLFHRLQNGFPVIGTQIQRALSRK